MRRLSLLMFGLVLAWLGARVAASAEAGAAYQAADGLLLGLVGGLVFALNAGGWLAPPVLRRRRGLPRAGWTLLLTGLVVTVGGGLGLAMDLPGVAGLTAAAAWGLGIVLQLAGAWWPGSASEYARPATRWGRDAGGNIVPLPAGEGEESAPRRRELEPPLGVRAPALWLLAVLALAALLRFWNLEQLPPGCIDQECITALRLLEPDNANVPGTSEVPGTFSPAVGLALDLRLAALLARAMPAGLLGLRLAGALLGWLAVLFTALALRRLAAPLPALLGAALLAVSPWHLWAGRTSDPWLAAACLCSLALWLGLEALARNHARWWLPWGLAVGLLAAQTPALWPGVALWALSVAALGLARAWGQGPRVGAADLWRWPLCALVAALGAALPAYGAAAALQYWPLAAGEAAGHAATLLAALLQPGAAAGGLLPGGLLDALSVALALVGIGALLRHLRQPSAGLVLAGGAALGGAATLLGPNAMPAATPTVILPATALLPLLPLLVGAAAVALDRLLMALVKAWGPPLVRTSTLLAGSALLFLLLAGRGAVALLWDLDSVRSGGEAQVEADMARYIAAQLQAEGAPGAPAVTFVAPRAVLDQPSLRLLGGAALDANRVLALELGRTLPLAQLPVGDVEYLLPLLDNQLLQLLRELYPSGETATELDAAGEHALFNRFRVSEAGLRQAQALSLLVAPADSAAAADGAAQPLAVTTTDFDWASAPPRALPFTAQGSGSLVAPHSGNYTFAVENSGPESTFTLRLDDILLLDSSLGLRQQQMPLPRGIHRLEFDYRSGNQPGDLRITWQAEGEEPQPLGAPLLHSPQLPDQGLLGDYYGNERFEGAPVAAHKDPILGLDPGLSLPYSVYWHGLLAAPRAGDYLIGVDAPGAAQVTVNGLLLADNRAGLPAGETGAAGETGEQENVSSYSEGLIYLPAGWHSIEVRYAVTEPTAAGAPESIRLLWQPPGSDPSEVASGSLLPAYGLVGPVDAPLPPAPALTDPLLGDDHFALSRPAAVWQPSVRVPPANLPPLALERLWTAGGVCGDAPDQLNAPHGAAFAPDGSRLYVADTGNRRIQVFDTQGLLVETMASEALQEPVAVALDAGGNLLVLDALAQQIMRANSNGELEPLPLQTSFYRPRGLAVDGEGNLVVADTGGARVVVLGPDGAQSLAFGGQGSLLGRGQPVDVLPAAGALWAVSAEDGRLWNLTSNGGLTAVQPTGTVDGPRLAQLRDGRLLASDPRRATFVLFSPAGEPLAQFDYAGELQLPTGIAVTSATEGEGGEVIAVVDTQACAVSAWRLAQ